MAEKALGNSATTLIWLAKILSALLTESTVCHHKFSSVCALLFIVHLPSDLASFDTLVYRKHDVLTTVTIHQDS